MKDLLKKIFSLLSYVFGLLVFSTIFLLFVSLFESLNLRPVSPVFNWYINSNPSVYKNSKITSLYLKIDNANNSIKINSNSKFWNYEDFKWELNLKNEVEINLRFRDHSKKFIEFKINTNNSNNDKNYQIKYFSFLGNLKKMKIIIIF